MKVSIIGTNGFLSRVMAKYCNTRGWQLDMYGLASPDGHNYNNFYKTNLLTDDIDYSSLIDSDIIIYASGAGIQSNLNEDNNLIYSLNVTVPVNICNKLRQKDYRGIIITFGSIFEIGRCDTEHAFTETEILTSIYPAPNDYTVSKRILTRFVDSYSHPFTHWHFILPTIYGESENPMRLIPYTINAIRHNQRLCLTSGDQVRQYIYVDEVPHIIEAAYQKQLSSGVYNIAGAEIHTVREIVTMIHKHFGLTVPHDCFGTAHRSDTGMKYLALDGTKLQNHIGYIPSVTIEDVIDKY